MHRRRTKLMLDYIPHCLVVDVRQVLLRARYRATQIAGHTRLEAPNGCGRPVCKYLICAYLKGMLKFLQESPLVHRGTVRKGSNTQAPNLLRCGTVLTQSFKQHLP